MKAKSQTVPYHGMPLSATTSLTGIAPVLLIALTLISTCFHLNAYPAVWFDEGYMMNAAHTLAERGVYGTYMVSGVHPFDPGITAGPLQVFLTALSFKVFGYGVLQARLVSVLFTLGALFGLYAIGRYLAGERGALVSVLFVALVPVINGDTSLMLTGRQVLGEPGALLFIVLGFWLWFLSWQNANRKLSLLAGLCLGLAILSKSQLGITLVPALLLVASVRWLKDGRFSLMFVPVAVSVGVFALWFLAARLLTPSAFTEQNSAMLLDGIRSNLLTDLAGRGLDRSSWFIIGVMTFSVVITIGYLAYKRRTLTTLTNIEWAELTLAVFILFSTVWFTLLSVGWPRYAYIPFILSLLLIGRFFWSMCQHTLEDHRHAPLYAVLVLGLFVGALLTNLLPALSVTHFDNAEAVAQYVAENIPESAVIESWEWELDALSQHWQVHHPPQQYLFQAIRESSHGEPFSLSYDLLQAEPDYLITGTMSDWTALYSWEDIERYFVEVERFGVYGVYKRIDLTNGGV